jgi:RluA family pseudouridine synthase
MNDYGFSLLRDEGACLLVSKPPGLLTQAPPGIDSLELRLRAMLRARDPVAERIYLGVPHRLDRPASGVMVFGRSRGATQRLAEQFESRLVDKVYWACVEGRVEPASGRWEDYLRKVPGEARSEVVPAGHSEGRFAALAFRVLARYDWGSWLQIELETGRTHQIRIQAASRGHPLLGDTQYGGIHPFGVQHEDPRLRAIALHARRLRFSHPKTRQPIEATAPLPEAWAMLSAEPAGGGTAAGDIPLQATRQTDEALWRRNPPRPCPGDLPADESADRLPPSPGEACG